MRWRWLALIASLLSLAAFADEGVFAHPQTADGVRALLSAPARELGQALALRGRFEQRKYLRELPQPLRSEGDFLFVRDLGIIWHTRQPLDTELVLTATGMRQLDGGRLTMTVSTSEQPALQVALRLFMALFSLDVAMLSGDFKLYGQAQEERWQLGLRPRQAALSQVFDEARISGAHAVERIELRDRNGDRTEISILQLQGSAQISAE